MLQSRPDSEETSTDAATASPSGRGLPTTTRVAEEPCDASLLFKRRVEANGNAANIADLAVVTWHDVLNVLSPVIGPGGVAELYKRSLHLVCADYPWLSAVTRAHASRVTSRYCGQRSRSRPVRFPSRPTVRC
ncbi:MAG: hypothetical protein IPO35_05220 [Uliginosibacterium sp.]|nr:hypothetical protein [Uliginosibacterium sp.]